MSEFLSRDELIEKATRALHADHCCNGDATGCAYPDEMRMDRAQAVIATDAALSAVADDLEAQGRVIYKYNIPKAVGIGVAAERVRGLLGKDTANE